MTDKRYIPDTNVISEEGKRAPHPGIMQWLNEVGDHRLHMSAVVLGEARRWVAGMPDGRKKRETRRKMEKWENWPPERVLPVTLDIALLWGDISVRSQPLQGGDGLIAATALAHGMTLVTRNVRDFRAVAGLSIFNPWADD